MARADLAHGRVMRLGLSSAAAPEALLDELVAAGTARGIEVIELREGDACLPDAESPSLAGVANIAGVIPTTCDSIERLARISRTLGAPVILACDDPLDERIAMTRAIDRSGGRAMPLVAGPSGNWIDAIARADVAWAWEIDAVITNLAQDADVVLRHARRVPSYIRLIGGGPEAAMNEGRGTGTLMARLALAGYAGPMVLVPSSRRYRIVWSTWLGRRGGWGCGSKVADPSLVQL